MGRRGFEFRNFDPDIMDRFPRVHVRTDDTTIVLRNIRTRNFHEFRKSRVFPDEWRPVLCHYHLRRLRNVIIPSCRHLLHRGRPVSDRDGRHRLHICLRGHSIIVIGWTSTVHRELIKSRPITHRRVHPVGEGRHQAQHSASDAATGCARLCVRLWVATCVLGEGKEHRLQRCYRARE